MEKMHGSGGSGKVKMRMSNMVVFGSPVLEKDLAGINLNQLKCTPETLRRTTLREWEATIDKLLKVRPNKANEIIRLIALRDTDRLLLGSSRKVDRLNEQRDGLGLSLEIAQLDKRPVLKKLNIKRVNEAKSVFDLLDDIPVQERSLVEHDRRIFKLLLEEEPTREAFFTNGNNRSVGVYVVDKTNLESVLGIDLIIYSSTYENYLLIQYKRMKKYSNGWTYPVDKQMWAQLNCMLSFKSAIQTNPLSSSTLWSYRLNENPFYFKFCEQIRPNAKDDSLIPGITMCESHLRDFLSLKEAKRKGGGIQVGYHNCPRYFNNTEFIALARSGWIGAGKGAAELLKKVLEANKSGSRSAMLTVINTPKSESALGRARWN